MKNSFLLLLLTLAGCAAIIDRFRPQQKVAPRTIGNAVAVMCPAVPTRSPQLVGSNPAAQRHFTEFLRSPVGKELDFREQAVLWTLIQINLRPDLVSPTSRLQFFWRENNATEYHDFTATEDDQHSYPLFTGLEQLLKGHPKKRPLGWYARLLDQHFTAHFVAGKTLETRLLQMQAAIADQDDLRRYFYRGDDVLRESERLTKVHYAKLVSEWQKVKRPTPVTSTMFSYRRTPKLDVRCNYDFTLYDNSIFLIDKEENQGHIFGLTLGDKAFMAVAAQRTPAPRALFGEPVIAGTAKVRSSAFCVIQNPTGQIWVVANQSRDPGQHVYHLFRYGLADAKKNSDLERLVRHSRHMFLADPLRLVIESNRSREEQVQELLKLNVPIYNASHMGNIWAWADFDQLGGHFFIDDRNPGALFCSP